MNNKESLSIALMGTRGVPASYGGFETFVEELGKRLSARGHRVTVFCRRRFWEACPGTTEYLGMKLVYAPTFMQKYLETPVHSLTSFLTLFTRSDYDAVLLCNAANSPFAWMVKLRRIPLFINVDGIERNRKKWSLLGRLWYKLGERCSVLFGTHVIADADVIADYYKATFRIDPVVIRYGADPKPIDAGSVLEKFGLKKDSYILYVSRLEPENNALGVIQAYKTLTTDLPLVIVGDAPYAKEYIENLHREARDKGEGSSNIIFTGFQFGEAYRELRTNCHLYIQATEVGGTHPALVEAMAYGNCVVANDVPEHREVLGDAGLYYGKNDFTDLASILSRLLSDPGLVMGFRDAAQGRARELFSWDKITDSYERLFKMGISRS